MAKLSKPRLRERYEREIVPALMKEFQFDNVMRVPKVKKVVVNIGLGEAISNPKAMESAEKDMATISGQHPSRDPFQEVNSCLQTAHGHAHWDDGDVAGPADV